MFFWKHQFALITHKIFLIRNRINIFKTKSLRKFSLEDFFFIFFLSFLWLCGTFCTSENLAFGFTSSKSHLLPFLNALNALKKEHY